MSGKKGSLCPECGKPASGNFCEHCGSSLGGRFCGHCGAEVPPGGGYCNQCGTAATSRRRRPGRAPSATAPQQSDLSWWIAGASAFALVVVVGWFMVPSPSPVQPDAGSAPAAASPVDISRMSPRQMADQLFNQAMTAREAGDTAQTRQVLPVAMEAYEAARPLDLDGLFHLALLQRAAGQVDSSLGTGLQMLQTEPNHILALEVAAQGALALGRSDEAEGYFRQILEQYDAEIARPLPEYQGHMRLLEVARGNAQAFLAGG